MSLMRSPSEVRGGSQPDLSKFSDEDHAIATAKPKKVIRKRKESMPEFDMKYEFERFTNEMRSFFSSFTDMQKESTNKMQRDMTEIKEQLNGIKVSTNLVIEDQNKIKVEIEKLKSQCDKNEQNISQLQTSVRLAKTSQPSTSQSQPTSFTYEEVLLECQERTQRQKNIIVLGIPESLNDDNNDRFDYDRKEILNVLNTLNKNCPEPVKMFRIGKFTPGKNRLIKVCFESEQTTLKLLRDRGNLQNNIKIFSDQTANQQNHLKCLREELLQRQESGETHLTIRYIRGTPKIVSEQPKN